MRVAYVCNYYPSISNTFMLSEVEALRRRGVEVHTFSVRRAAPEHAFSAADRRARESTVALLPLSARRAARALCAAARRPVRVLAGLRVALRHRPAGLRGLAARLAYLGEAVMVWDECRRRGVRHLHAHFSFLACDVALLAAAIGGPGWSYSFTVHGPDELFDVSRTGLGRKAAGAAFVACITDFARSQVMAHTPREHWERLHVVRCGIDVDRFRPGPVPVEDGQPEPHVLCIGRLTPFKGQGVLLEAVAELERRGVPVRVTIGGFGADRERLEALARRLGIEGRVTFTGPLDHGTVADLYRSADVFCLASFAEGLPIVLMEAMACGIPVVATRITGVPELVEHGVEGLLVSPARADQLASALERLARDPALGRRLGGAGREKVVACHDVDASAELLHALLRGEPVSGRGATAAGGAAARAGNAGAPPAPRAEGA